MAQRHHRNGRHERQSRLKALVLDFGGVLTNDFWEALRSFARREGLSEDALVELVTKDPQGVQLLRDLERGRIPQTQFQNEMAQRLGLPADGLLESMAADLRPDVDMLALVEELRAAGVRIGILSNSWGSDPFDPYAAWELDNRADVVVISDQVRLRKPEPEIFDLVVDKLGVPANECLFVDDVAPYLEPARVKGMAVWHHVNTAETVAHLRAVFAGYLRPSIVAAIIVHNGRVLLVRRRISEGSLSWQFPAGEQEPGEEPFTTAAREVLEEVGLSVHPQTVIGQRIHPGSKRHMIYVGCAAETDVARLVDEDELAELAWCTRSELAIKITTSLYEPVTDHLQRKVED